MFLQMGYYAYPPPAIQRLHQKADFDEILTERNINMQDHNKIKKKKKHNI